MNKTEELLEIALEEFRLKEILSAAERKQVPFQIRNCFYMPYVCHGQGIDRYEYIGNIVKNNPNRY